MPESEVECEDLQSNPDVIQYCVSLHIDEVQVKEAIVEYEVISEVIDQYREDILINIIDNGNTGYICVDKYQR